MPEMVVPVAQVAQVAQVVPEAISTYKHPQPGSDLELLEPWPSQNSP
jgi:hypothetical protein